MELAQRAAQLVNAFAHEEPEIGRNLLVAAAPAVQLLACFAHQRHELFLHKMVDVFCFRVRKEVRLVTVALDLVQRRQNELALFAGQYSRGPERAGVRAAGRQLEAQQLLVERKRPLPLLELRIQRLPEPARPHLHFAASSTPARESCPSWPRRKRARERAGRPRMRMNPAASFWS